MTTHTVNKDITITCETYSNSRAWGHEVRCIYKGNEIEKNRIRYYNRTWEPYVYYDAMLGLVDKLDKEARLPLRDRIAMARYIKSKAY